MARHCFEVHVAFDIGEHGPLDVAEAVEQRLAEARDALVLLQADLGGQGGLSITVEDWWPVGDTGSTQPLVDELEADEELMAKLRREDEDPLGAAMRELDRALRAAREAWGRHWGQAAREGGQR